MIFQLCDYQVRALNAVTTYAKKTLPHRSFLHDWMLYQGYAAATDSTTLLLCETFPGSKSDASPFKLLRTFAPVRTKKALTSHMLTFDVERARVAGIKSEQQDLKQTDRSLVARKAMRAVIDLYIDSEREKAPFPRHFDIDAALLGRIAEAVAAPDAVRPAPTHLCCVHMDTTPTIYARWGTAASVEAFAAVHQAPVY